MPDDLDRHARGSGRASSRNLVADVNREDPLLRVLVMSRVSAGRRPAEVDGRDDVDVTVTGSFDDFYLREMRGLVALVLVLSGNASTAEDVAQDAMVAAYKDWDRITTLDDPASWVRRIAANRATSAVRRRSAELRALTRLGGRRLPRSPLPCPARP